MKERVLNALILAGISVGISLAAYFGWFFVVLKLPLSKSPEVWGQFGSYMAGTAGVSFALATVWMLADTLRLQRSELQLSRIEMQRSSDALSTQVKLTEKSNSKQNFFYILQSVNENIEAISNQTIGNAPNIPIVKALFNSNTLRRGEPQLLAIAAQYVSLVYYIENLDEAERSDAVIISHPIIVKNYNMFKMLLDNGYFDSFKPCLKTKALVYLENSHDLIYRKSSTQKK